MTDKHTPLPGFKTCLRHDRYQFSELNSECPLCVAESPPVAVMTDKHTPGPWDFFNGDRVYGPNGPNGESGPLVAMVKYHAPDSEIEPNGRLIAAAPELLDALRGLLDTCELNLDDMEPDTRAAIRRAVDAVQKATNA